MAIKKKAQESAGTASTPPLPIERLRELKKVSRAVFAGVCAANGWRPGRMMSEKEFTSAVDAFTKAPIAGAKKQGKRG